MPEPKKESASQSLDWLAFCYISDELNDRDRLQFEDRLAEDQQARDAVVRQVDLAHAIDGCLDGLQPPIAAEKRGRRGTDQANSSPRGRFKPAAVLAVSVVMAGLAIAWTIQWNRNPTPVALDSEEQLLDAWEFTRLNPVSFDLDEESPVLGNGDARFLDLNEPSDRAAADGLDLDHSWMALALSELETADHEDD